ncbi:acyltransferase family protein [Stappia stellulata]|uniref:acyltransferase family protein n=1 Tax=Stappia stellulata TaxID=71235 RepID=UPI000425DE69|nr:acyltransferase [Stappia stellulata]
MNTATRRPGLDVLRVLAVAAVAWFHFGFRMQVTGEAGPLMAVEPGELARYGYLGVSIFFAISGYVISISTEGRDAYGFAVARVARLWPTFVVCMSLTALVMLAVPGLGLPAGLAPYLANLTMLAPFLGQPFMDGAYWSIVVEIIFYAWVGLLMVVRVWRNWQVWIAAVWLVIAALDLAVFGSDLLRRLLLTDFAGFFAFGMMLRALERKEAAAGVVLVAAFVQSLAGAAAFAARLPDLYVGAAFSVPVVLGSVAGGLAMLVLLVRLPARALPVAAVSLAGRATYPFYLLHQHIGYAAYFLFVPILGFAVTSMALIASLIAAALLVSLVVETPAARGVRALGAGLRSFALARIRAA